jgi:hypothetical protein
MSTWLKGDDRSTPNRSAPSLTQSDNFRVRQPRTAMVTPTDDHAARIEDDAAYAWVSATAKIRMGGQCDRFGHRIVQIYCTASRSAMARNCCTMTAGSGARKTAEPATKDVAPARAASAIVSSEMPPST